MRVCVCVCLCVCCVCVTNVCKWPCVCSVCASVHMLSKPGVTTRECNVDAIECSVCTTCRYTVTALVLLSAEMCIRVCVCMCHAPPNHHFVCLHLYVQQDVCVCTLLCCAHSVCYSARMCFPTCKFCVCACHIMMPCAIVRVLTPLKRALHVPPGCLEM